MGRFIVPDTYAVWSKNSDTRFCSTSGGVFTEFARAIISDGGCVVGAKYNNENLVEHDLIDNIEDIEKLRQSKYMSSSMGNIYKRVKAELVSGRLVGFCGSPCQVAGLYYFLGKEYDNLFTMDFICRGMNSPKAFKAWLNEIEHREGRKVIKVWFKYKDGGWKTSPRRTRLDFENGSHRVYEDENNLYMYGYLTSNLYIRPCCGDCHFKGVPRKSDVTFADFWGIDKELDDDKGTSMLLVNSNKGREYFKKIHNNLNAFKKDFSSIFDGNPMFTTSAEVPQKGHDFLIDLDNLSFSEDLKKYDGYPVQSPIWKRCFYKIKHMVKKILKR